MEKIIDTKAIQYTTYDAKDPFDVAESIVDDVDGVRVEDHLRILHNLLISKALNDFGKRIYEHIYFRVHDKLDDFEIRGEEIEKIKKEHDEWLIKNNQVYVEQNEPKTNN